MRSWNRSFMLLAAAAVVSGLLLAVVAGAAPGAGLPPSSSTTSSTTTSTTTTSTTPIGAYTTKGAWSFASAPKLHPPKLAADHVGVLKQLAPGYFMTASFPDLSKTQPTSGKPQKMAGQSGPFMIDNRLQPVWFNPVPQNVVAANLKTQTYNGKPALSWWQGVLTNTGQIVSGELEVVDQSYKKVASLKGADGWVITLHDAVVSGHNVWVTANKNMQLDLTPYGGSGAGTMIDSAVQEYDLQTGKLLSTWDAMEHIPLSDSYQKPIGKMWDPYHVNSVQVSGGSFITSMRNTWAAYQVNSTTGAIDWTLGGKHSTFTFAKNAQFQWQHDVQLNSGNVVSVFDDHCCLQTGATTFDKPSGSGRGLLLKLDMTKHTATMVGQYLHQPSLTPKFLGSMEPLSNGNAVVGWGVQPFFSEYSKAGKLLLDVVWPMPDQSYRAEKERWTGKPFFPPSGTARTSRGTTTVYASWDGATQVASWRVLAGSSSSHLTTVASAGKSGFETAIRLAHSYKAYKVQALDSNHHVLRTSNVFPKPRGGGGTGGFY
jgi:Arylsulfotransferase (ASST)